MSQHSKTAKMAWGLNVHVLNLGRVRKTFYEDEAYFSL